MTCLAKDDETGAIWFAGRYTHIGPDPRVDNEAAYAQAQAEVVAGRYLMIGRLSDRDGDNLIDHASFFNTPTLVALPNVLETGDATQVTDLKSWEKALDGPVTAENACLDKDAFFLRVGTAEVLQGNKLRFTHKKKGRLFGKVHDGRFPIPRSAPRKSVVDYSDIDLPTSAESSLSTRLSLQGAASEYPGGGGGGYSGGSEGVGGGGGGGGGGSYYRNLAHTTAVAGANGFGSGSTESRNGRVAIAKMSNLNCGEKTKADCCRDVRPYDREFTYTGAFEYYTVPEAAEYCVAAWGAQGGSIVPSDKVGGWGARITGTMTLEEGEELRIGVGGRGLTWDYELEGSNQHYSGGGGGASSVVKVRDGDHAPPFNTLPVDIVVMAAGGGGASRWYPGGPGQTGEDALYLEYGGSGCDGGACYRRSNCKGHAGGGFCTSGLDDERGGQNYRDGHQGGRRACAGRIVRGGFGGGGVGIPFPCLP